MIFSSMMIATGLLLFSSNVDVIMGIPADLVKGDYLFGRTIGIVDDENAKPLMDNIWNLEDQFIKSNSRCYKQ